MFSLVPFSGAPLGVGTQGVTLAGTATVSTSVVAGLNKYSPIAATAAVVTTSSVTLDVRPPQNTSTLNGWLLNLVVLNGAGPVITALNGSVVCFSSASGYIEGAIPLATLAGTAAVSNVISAAPVVDYIIESTATAQATGTASLKLSIPLQGDLAASVVSSNTALVNTIPLAGSCVASVTTSAAIGVDKNLGCNLAVVSAASGAVTLSKPLGVQAVVESTGTGNVRLAIPIAGSGTSTVSQVSDLPIGKTFASSITAATTTAGAIGVSKNLGANPSVVSSATGGIVDRIPLAAAAQSTVDTTAGLSLVVPIAGTSTARASTTATVRVDILLSATVLTVVSSSANLHLDTTLADLEGTGAVTNVINASLKQVIPLRSINNISVEAGAEIVATHAIELDDLKYTTSAEVSYVTPIADAVALNVTGTYSYSQIIAEAELVTITPDSSGSPVYGDATYTFIVAEAEKLDALFKLAA